MKYVLFLGGKLGLISFKKLMSLGAEISFVFVDEEHEHEIERYFDSIKFTAENYGIKYLPNPKKKDIKNAFDLIKSVDYIFSFGHRKLIQKEIIKKANIGAFGSHFSPLPKYRGFAPLNWLLINGEKETAVNLFYLEDEIDSGDIIASKKVNIEDSDDINSLFDKCIVNFLELLENSFYDLQNKSFVPIKQNHFEATYTCSRNPEDGIIDWRDSSNKICNQIKALTFPFPGAFTYYNGQKIIILKAEQYLIKNYVGIIPGKVISILRDDGIVVLCGSGAVLIKKVFYDDQIINVDQIVNSIRVTLGK